MIYALIAALIFSICPAFAEVTPVPVEDGPVLKGPMPPAVLSRVEPEGYGEAHPVVAAPFVAVKKCATWTGQKLKINKIGGWVWDKTKATGAAASDAFVVFGKKTEKYHPGMQTISYGVGIALPVLLKLVPKN